MDESTNPHLTGWCNDPYGRHEHRWMAKGEPTDLVGDGGVESHDPPLEGPFVVAPILVEDSPANSGDDLRRADEPSPEDADETVRTQMMAEFGRLNPF